ncbi:MAG: hypothetical protein QOD89_2003 [Bradyrhizobium sp.]|jgi:cell division septum initiation protein DivIVA|nr:hypothetical protein [Bradyrhizobium sp.]
MADQTFRSTDKGGAPSSPGSSSFGNPGSATHGFEKAAGAATSTAKGVADQAKGVTEQAKSVADQALSASRELKDKAVGLAGSSAEAIKGRASDAMDAAKDMAAQATDKLKQTVDGQKNAGADYVGNLADTMRRAAREFDNDLPIAGAYIRKAAAQIEGVSDQIKTGNITDLVRGAQSFARRQPTAFLGLAVLAGFGAVRFLKSSANSPDASSQSNRGGGAGFAPYQAGRSYAADNRGYRDEFTK